MSFFSFFFSFAYAVSCYKALGFSMFQSCVLLRVFTILNFYCDDILHTGTLNHVCMLNKPFMLENVCSIMDRKLHIHNHRLFYENISAVEVLIIQKFVKS